jgi:hypothetical protein
MPADPARYEERYRLTDAALGLEILVLQPHFVIRPGVAVG